MATLRTLANRERNWRAFSARDTGQASCSKRLPARPQGAWPPRRSGSYVEVDKRLRTQLGGVFSSLLEVPGAAGFIRIRHNRALFVGIFFKLEGFGVELHGGVRLV